MPNDRSQGAADVSDDPSAVAADSNVANVKAVKVVFVMLPPLLLKRTFPMPLRALFGVSVCG